MWLTQSAGKSCERVTIGFGFTSDWMKRWRESFKPIASCRKCKTNYFSTLKWKPLYVLETCVSVSRPCRLPEFYVKMLLSFHCLPAKSLLEPPLPRQEFVAWPADTHKTWRLRPLVYAFSVVCFSWFFLWRVIGTMIALTMGLGTAAVNTQKLEKG